MPKQQPKDNQNTKKGEGRTRNFVTIVYPESAPKNWIEILDEMHISAFISPLHDMDCNADGEVKKAHYHVIIMFDSVKTESQAQEIIDKIGGVGYQKVNSIRAHSRYLCHLDNADKHQYPITQVIALGGANYGQLISSPSDKYGAIKEMIQWCKETGTIAYCDLLDYALENREDWYITLCDNGTYIVKEYLKSKSWLMEQSYKAKQLLDEKIKSNGGIDD